MPFNKNSARIFSVFFVTFLTMISFAKAAKTKGDGASLLKATTKRYQSSALVEMKVVKTLKSELMGKETTYIGKIAISAGRFRWENSEPEKSILVYDGETIWNEQSPPADFPGDVQVIKSKVDKKNKSQVLLSSLLGKSSIFENFEIVSESKEGDLIVYTVKPKVSDSSMNDLKLSVIAKEKKLEGISYKDDVGNTTEMKFSNVKFLDKANKNLFKYTPPKGAQVTNL